MTALFIGNLFLFAAGISAAAFPVALLTRGASWNNTATQILFLVSGLTGLSATGLFFTGHAQGVFTSIVAYSFVVTPLSALFLGIVYAGVALTSVYSIGALPRYKDVYSLPWLNATSAVFMLGMQGLLFAPSALFFLLSWELMSIAGYFLVIADTKEDSLRAGLLYFIMTHVGFLSLVSGFLILSGGNPAFTWGEIAAHAATLGGLQLGVAFMLLFIGFGSKAGLVPLHQWLPHAHPQAPSGSSALLSGVMLKMAVFGFLSSLALFTYIPLSWAFVVILAGLTSAFFGALHATVEDDAKRLLAWSSIENMGLIFSAIGMFLVVRTLGVDAAPIASLFLLFVVVHSLNHFAFKSGLFMAAGIIQSETHTRDLDALGGLAQKWPVFSAVFLALSLAAAALPPMGTFFGEWAYVQALALGLFSLPIPYAIAAAVALGIIGLVAGLAVFSFVKLFSAVFLGRARSEAAEHVGDVPLSMTLPIALCAVLSLVIGVLAFPALREAASGSLVGYAGAVPAAQGTGIMPWSVVALIALTCALAWLLYRSFMHRRVRVTGTWDCGTPLTPRMQYTATGFSAPMRFFFRALLQSKRHLVTEAVAHGNPWITTKHLEWNIGSVWDAMLYRPLGHGIFALASVMRKIQSGVVQFYLILVLVTLIAALFIAL